jgi:alkylation response protein AidB-like acyl-CoA dehydrogenase
MGRLKLGGNVLGAAKMAINQSVNYANERKQFGMLISEFGTIKHKLAQQVIRTFTVESAVYRASMNVDQIASDYEIDCLKEQAQITAFAQLAIEAAILKVAGSEALDYIADEAVQIFGGMGYSAEMPVDRGYRDSRINRIFEGTNEINRILLVDTLLKRGQKKEIPLFEAAEEAYNGFSDLSKQSLPDNYFELKRLRVSDMKKAVLALVHVVSNKFGRKLVFEQEILNSMADMIIHIYLAESTLLRVWKLANKRGEENVGLFKDMLDVYAYDAAALLRKAGMDAVNSMAEGDEYSLLMKGIEYYTQTDPVNTKDARRRIADKIIEENKYVF